MTWTLDYSQESDLDDSTGYWLVYPSPADPSKTRVEYTVDLRVSGWYLASSKQQWLKLVLKMQQNG